MTAEQRLAWLIDRQSGIGSSDAPSLIGVGFNKAIDIYRSKIDPITPFEANRTSGILKRGTLLEPLVGREYTELFGEELLPSPDYPLSARHPERRWQSASRDFIRASDGKPVECKTVNYFDGEWGGSGTDDVPEGYLVQVQHQMGVCGEPSIDIAALGICNWELRVYRVMFNAPFFDWLTAVERNAWQRIEMRQPLDEEWEASFRDEAAGQLEKIDTGTRMHLDVDRWLPLLEKRRKLGKIEDDAKAAKDAITDQLKAEMGSFHRAECAGWKLSKYEVKACHKDYDQPAYIALRASAPSLKSPKKGK